MSPFWLWFYGYYCDAWGWVITEGERVCTSWIFG
jgi:hypothetical protein